MTSNSTDAFKEYLKHLQDTGQVGSPVEIMLDHFTFRKSSSPPNEPSYILHDVMGTLKPGTMTLVLEPPQCGKTALLKTLAGVFHYKGQSTSQMSGGVTYNGQQLSQVHDLVTFVGQTDEHIPTLSVLETLEFAHACRGPSRSAEWQKSAIAVVDALGLKTCAHTRCFGWFLLLFFCYTLYATYMGQVFVAALPDLRTATVVSAALNSVFSIFSGFFIHRPDIPLAWRFLYWISPLHYMMEGVMSIQFLQNPANISLGSKSTGPLSPQPVAVQEYVAKFFDGSISYDNRFIDLVAILVWIVSLRILHALAMKFISHVTR
ncbi:hypothetical protein AC1031_002921 [Aphanomyces cochlioides]|nr:hypothetical protein AC1031_002921 [Aphanomyces cochlioides]